eukprot:500638_1
MYICKITNLIHLCLYKIHYVINNINIKPQIYSNLNTHITALIRNNFNTNYNQIPAQIYWIIHLDLIIGSQHYYQPVATYRRHPYANIQMQPYNSNTNAIIASTNTIKL